MMYIGHLLTAEGVQANPLKVEAITNLTNYLAKLLPKPMRLLRAIAPVNTEA